MGANRWRPKSEQDIQDAIDDNLLEETHYFDVKREVGATAKARKDTAAHLASFALDSGTLLVGVEQDKINQTWTLAPQPLNGLSERVEQVAQSAVDPALFVVTTSIPSNSDPTQGYLVVEIPESASAPHMVDGIYYGRGDKTRIKLSDTEVVRFHSRRESTASAINRLLEEERNRDHVPPAEQQFGRLYLVAQPSTGSREMALRIARGGNAAVMEIINPVEDLMPPNIRDFAPTPGIASQSVTRAEGLAMCSYVASGPGRTFISDRDWNDEGDLIDIEFREDGGIRFALGRMTANWNKHGPEAHTVIVDGLAVAYSLRLCYWAAAVARGTAYHGTWGFGILASGLRGHSSHVAHDRGGWSPTYDAEEYRHTTTATHLELLGQPTAVANRLVGRLLRGLGTDSHYGKYLT